MQTKLVDHFESVVENAFKRRAKTFKRNISASRLTKKAATVYWHPTLGVWANFNKRTDKYWNLFGVDDPSHKKSLLNTVQINPSRIAYLGTGGAFIHDDEAGDVFLAHSGRLGGTFIGKSAEFRKFFDTVTLTVGRDLKEYILISTVTDSNLIGRIADFVRTCSEYKARRNRARVAPRKV